MEFTQFYRKWFQTTPVNAKFAQATYAISGNVSDGELVYIGNEIFEFDTNSSVTEGNIAVDVSGGATKAAAKTALIAAINANSLIATAVTASGDNMTIKAKYVGTEPNSYLVADDATNGTFGLAETLTGGQYATPAATIGYIILSGVWYITTKPIDKYSTDGWYSMTPSVITGGVQYA